MFGSLIMRGLKLRSYQRLAKLLFLLKKKEKIEPRYLFLVICSRMTPTLVVKKQYQGRRLVLNPLPITPTRQVGFVIKSFIKPLKDSQVRRSVRLNKLAELFLQSLRRRGAVHKNLMVLYKQARLNRKPSMRTSKPPRVLKPKRRWRLMH